MCGYDPVSTGDLVAAGNWCPGMGFGSSDVAGSGWLLEMVL